jgi:hypothetical protein
MQTPVPLHPARTPVRQPTASRSPVHCPWPSGPHSSSSSSGSGNYSSNYSSNTGSTNNSSRIPQTSHPNGLVTALRYLGRPPPRQHPASPLMGITVTMFVPSRRCLRRPPLPGSPRRASTYSRDSFTIYPTYTTSPRTSNLVYHPIFFGPRMPQDRTIFFFSPLARGCMVREGTRIRMDWSVLSLGNSGGIRVV